MLNVRNSAKAIVVCDGKILCTRNVDSQGAYYLLPGGKQRAGETLVQTLVREVLEETGAVVTVDELRFVREYIGQNHEFADYDADVHQVELMFVCSISDTHQPSVGHEPDSTQVGVEWLPLDSLPKYRIYPHSITTMIVGMWHRLSLQSSAGDGDATVSGGAGESPIYMGDVN